MTIHRKKDADSILFNGLFFRHDFMNIFCKCMRKMKEKKNCIVCVYAIKMRRLRLYR